MSKKIVIFYLIFLIIFLSGVQPAYSMHTKNSYQIIEQIIQPRWTNAYNASLILDISMSPITVGFDIAGYEGTTFSNGSLVLTKVNGSHTGIIGTWTGLSSNLHIFEFEDYAEVPLTAGKYQLTLTITATRNGVSEVIELSKSLTR